MKIARIAPLAKSCHPSFTEEPKESFRILPSKSFGWAAMWPSSQVGTRSRSRIWCHARTPLRSPDPRILATPLGKNSGIRYLVSRLFQRAVRTYERRWQVDIDRAQQVDRCSSASAHGTSPGNCVKPVLSEAVPGMPLVTRNRSLLPEFSWVPIRFASDVIYLAPS
jgi:hypothetical protein